jgi:hypothetical protein
LRAPVVHGFAGNDTILGQDNGARRAAPNSQTRPRNVRSPPLSRMPFPAAENVPGRIREIAVDPKEHPPRAFRELVPAWKEASMGHAAALRPWNR